MIEVRFFREDDLDTILDIDATSNPHPWRSNSLKECLLNDMVLVAEQDQCVIGFCLLYNAVDKIELLSIVTDHRCRRQGVARLLLDEAKIMGAAQGFERMVLEVRASNLSAQQLYKSHGFLQDGTRKNYYPLDSGHEDALLFSFTFER